VLLSLSRMALLVALVSVGITIALQMVAAPGGLLPTAPPACAGAILLAGLVLWQASTFYDRYFEGYTQVEIGGLSFSTSGRTEIWPTVIASPLQHPIVGGGLGSAELALGAYDNANVGHPHN